MENHLFDTFWAAYPKKVAKQKAYRAFCKINPGAETVGEMVADINRRKQSDQWRKNGGMYIPYPTTYLNDRRWEDEVELPAPTERAHSYDLEEYKSLMNKF